MKATIFVLILIIGFISCQPQKEDIPIPDYTEFVVPLMGTDSDFKFSHGNVYPAIARPFGMGFWTAQTGDMGSGWIYQYKADSIQGIRQTHQPSPWMNDYGAFSFMPLTGDLKVNGKERASAFSHDSEIVKPYYYSVDLESYGIKAEVTPTERAAILRFTYPESDQSWLLLDAFFKGSSIRIIPEEKKVLGLARNNSGGTPENFANYFVAYFNVLPVDAFTWKDGELRRDEKENTGEHVGAALKFETSADMPIVVRIGSSFISHKQAELNLKTEIGDKTFTEIMNEGRDIWNKELSRISVEGGTEDQRQVFYSCLYRSLLFPRIFYELNEQGQRIHYSPFDGSVHEGLMFADNGFWDTFRAVFPFFTLMYPTLDAQFMQWLVNAYAQGGWLPIWPSPGYRQVMIGVHGASLFADAMVKGIRDFDMDNAFDAVLKDAYEVPPSHVPGRKGVEYYNELGYVPYPEVRESTARTLEYAYDDFCIRQMAEVLGKEEKVQEFEGKSFNYRNVYDPERKLMSGRNIDGDIIRDIHPLAWGGPFTEGNAWHYTWSVFHDIQGLIDLMEGESGFITMMDSVFTQPPEYDVGSYGFEIHEITEMVAGNMGQYAHGNQPIQHMIYLYNYAGQPWKTQYRIREVMEKLYSPTPDGYCGDEDNGQTSAWYVFSALGFYPACPGVPEYVIGSPLFDKVTIDLENGNQLEIIAKNNSTDNRYIQKLKVNGEVYDKTYLLHKDLMNGGRIEFEMGPEPNKMWATAQESRPYSLSNNI